MPKYRASLVITVKTLPVVLEADDRQHFGRMLDAIDVGELVRTRADTLHISCVEPVERVMDNAATYEPQAAQLESKKGRK